MWLRNYLDKLHQALERLENYGYAESIDITEEIRAGRQAIIKVRIVLVDGSVLHIKEYVDAKYKIEKVSYAYQYQDRDGKLIFRYDNAVHRPALLCREHKHKKDGVIVEASLPAISDVIDEVIECL